MPEEINSRLSPFFERYSRGEWRASVFRDVILDEAGRLAARGIRPTLLDIGCGKGFDDDPESQRSLANAAGRYIGVEPDEEMRLGDIFTDKYACPFEEAPLERDSVDIAFAVMVLEHVEDPQKFWNQLNLVLKKGGVFWGFTVDARHIFVTASLLMEKMGIKDRYLNKVRGTKGVERYENYGVFYRTNTPEAIKSFTKDFSRVDFLPFNRPESFAYYLPQRLRWAAKLVSRFGRALHWPHSILVVRVEK